MRQILVEIIDYTIFGAGIVCLSLLVTHFVDTGALVF